MSNGIAQDFFSSLFQIDGIKLDLGQNSHGLAAFMWSKDIYFPLL